jgi:hypothetical protein
MEAELYRALYRRVYAVAHPPRRAREQYDDRWIVMVYLWSVLHDRPVCWACDADNWPKALLLDRPLPSPSRMSRRLRTVGVQQLLQRVLEATAELFPVPLVKTIDSKPLCVGAYSKDRDAKRGRLADGQFARGYRLSALTHGRIVQAWTLMPMNQHDTHAAKLLLPKLAGGGYVLADNAYDSNENHLAAAAANHQLVAPPREVNKGVRDTKYNCPQRLRALDLLDSPLGVCGLRGEFGRELYNLRQRVESCFGGLTFIGLDHLPSWVRGPRRVALWTAGKILVYLCGCVVKQRLM